MPSPIEDRRPPITPQLAVRVAVLGGMAFVLFAIIFFRLWFLQVLTGDDYVSQARDNRVRKVKIEAPRGNIVDRNGKVLVKTRAAPVVQILPDTMPDAEIVVADAVPQGARRGRGAPAAAAAQTCARSSAGCAPTAARRAAPRSASGRKLARAVRARRRGARSGAIPAGEHELRSLYRRLGKVIEVSPRDDPPARGPGDRRPAVGERDDQDRRRRARRSTTCSSTARRSRASSSRRGTCATTRSRRSAPSCSARCARSRPTSSGPRSTAA